MESSCPDTSCASAWLEIGKIAVPVVLGLLIWAIQTLAQRAWNEYETRRDVYINVVLHIDSLFKNGDKERRVKYLAAIRTVWIVGSDNVVIEANHLSDTISVGADSKEHSDEAKLDAYSAFIAEMRRDLRKWRIMPPRRTALSKKNFPVQEAGS